MITITGRGHQYCDGISRRSFIRLGALGFAGLSLADLLRSQARANSATRGKSVIMVFLGGGPPHLDMYDMKPEAPREIRGEFQAIHTNVPGINVCELLPMHAKIADQLAILRGVQLFGHHEAHEFLTGWPWGPSVPFPKRPTIGAVVSKFRGAPKGMFPYVSLAGWDRWDDPAYAGPAHRPFFASKRYSQAFADLVLSGGVTLNRVDDRRVLLQSFDKLRREMDAGGAMAGADAFTDRALDLITSSKARDALDVSKEPESTRQKYGDQDYFGLEGPGPQCLQARRLVEAGVSVVTIALGAWDTHQNNFSTMRVLLPLLDQALYGLVTDLHERGLAGDVAVVVGGEMGRSPKINDQAGREHWPEAGNFVVAGGGFRMGQIIGETDRIGAQSIGKQMRMPNILATLYRFLGIDPATTIADNSSRPIPLLEEREPIAELL